MAVLITDDSITTGGGSSGPPRPDRRVWRDYVGNWWWPRPWHAVAAQMAVWVGWTTQETMRQPLGVLGRVYAAHARDDD